MPCPMPWLAPVTRATTPSSGRSTDVLLGRRSVLGGVERSVGDSAGARGVPVLGAYGVEEAELARTEGAVAPLRHLDAAQTLERGAERPAVEVVTCVGGGADEEVDEVAVAHGHAPRDGVAVELLMVVGLVHLAAVDGA